MAPIDKGLDPAEGLEGPRLQRLVAEFARRAKARDPRQDMVSHARQTGGTFQAPIWVFLDLTNECNQRCSFCFQTPPQSVSCHSLAQVDSLCGQFAAMGVDTLTLTGGEPTCHPEFLAAVAAGKGYGLSLKISTNGVSLTEDLIRRLALLLEPERDEIILSFDAAQRSTYRSLRGTDDYPALIRTLELLGRYRVPFATNTLILQANLGEIEEIITQAVSYGARECHVGPPYPKPQIAADIYARPPEVLEIYESLLLREEAESRLSLNPWHLGGEENYPPEMPAGFSCAAGYASCAVDAQGNVGVCQYALDLGAAVGNVYTSPFPFLWRQTQDWCRRWSGAGPNLAPACPAKALAAGREVDS